MLCKRIEFEYNISKGSAANCEAYIRKIVVEIRNRGRCMAGDVTGRDFTVKIGDTTIGDFKCTYNNWSTPGYQLSYAFGDICPETMYAAVVDSNTTKKVVELIFRKPEDVTIVQQGIVWERPRGNITSYGIRCYNESNKIIYTKNNLVSDLVAHKEYSTMQNVSSDFYTTDLDNREIYYLKSGDKFVHYNSNENIVTLVDNRNEATSTSSPNLKWWFLKNSDGVRRINNVPEPLSFVTHNPNNLDDFSKISKFSGGSVESSFVKYMDYTDLSDLAKKVDFFNIIGMNAKVIFQENNSLVWKAFDDLGNKIELVDESNDEIKLKGTPIEKMRTFIDKFNDLQNIKFGFLLEGFSELDKIQIQFDAHGKFRTIEPKITLNRTNLRVTTNKAIKLMKTNVLLNQ